jgi:hypothetical protein
MPNGVVVVGALAGPPEFPPNKDSLCPVSFPKMPPEWNKSFFSDLSEDPPLGVGLLAKSPPSPDPPNPLPSVLSKFVPAKSEGLLSVAKGDFCESELPKEGSGGVGFLLARSAKGLDVLEGTEGTADGD